MGHCFLHKNIKNWLPGLLTGPVIEFLKITGQLIGQLFTALRSSYSYCGYHFFKIIILALYSRISTFMSPSLSKLVHVHRYNSLENPE